ncbi:MAG: AAA family ATPase [Clostridiales bacterium]|nr:AAA family ATPase [Clostridiales bacterium]
MRTTKIVIKNLFGIKERKLDGKSIELSGPKGSGKTSVLDAIRYALTNRSDRDYIIRQGAEEGEILIETDSGLTIERKTRTQKADSIKVKDGNMLQTRPAEYLSGIFTPLQLNPIDFCQLSRQEKNRVILSLIEFDWDMNWIQEKFGEIPSGVDYSKHILEVLADIQSENGHYFQSRQNINRDIRNKQAFVADIAKDLPENYEYERWENYPIGQKYGELNRIQENNGVIARARECRDSYAGKRRGIEARREMAITEAEKRLASEREEIKAKIAALNERLFALEGERKAAVEIADAKYREEMAKLENAVGVAIRYADKEPEDTEELRREIETAEDMRSHLNEYRRMLAMQQEIDGLKSESEELTRKIELARELPSEILQEATIPIAGLTVREGIPLIHGMPISNLSDGELLELCVDITISRPGQLGIILIDGAERLDDASREALYKKCKDAGLQIIATRVSNSDELEVVEL